MKINKILSFKIKGKFAHFKKYYSNKSSLTYLIPPRTVLMGIVASVLRYPRDSYYDLLSPERAKFGIRVIKPGRPHFECMNYLKKDGGHTQVRLQLLLAQLDFIEYQVFFTHSNLEILNKLQNKIYNADPGFGLYFGQRPFRVYAEPVEVYEKGNIFVNKDLQSDIVTLTCQENIKQLNTNNNPKITFDNMPISFSKVNKGREQEKILKVCFEETGNKLKGVFKEVINIGEENITFYTPMTK